MSIAPEYKRCIRGERPEKALLRQAFDDPEDPWLPAEVLWRQKEQFSDGVGYNWIDSIKAWCEQQVRLPVCLSVCIAVWPDSYCNTSSSVLKCKQTAAILFIV